MPVAGSAEMPEELGDIAIAFETCEAEAKAALAKFAHMDGANRLLGRGILRFDMRDPARFVLRLPHEGQVAPAKLDEARAAVDAVAEAAAEKG